MRDGKESPVKRQDGQLDETDATGVNKSVGPVYLRYQIRIRVLPSVKDAHHTWKNVWTFFSGIKSICDPRPLRITEE